MTTELANDVTGAPPVRSSAWLDAIVCADCLNEMRTMPDELVDAVITDPPYGVDKAKWDAQFPRLEVWQEIWRVMKPGASLLVFPGEMDIPNKLALLVSVFDYQWVLVWYKPNAMQFGKTGYTKQSLVWWLSKGKPNASPKLCDVIERTLIAGDNRFGHPSPKPLDVMTPLVNHFSALGELVLDPYAGSGTTLVAAKLLNRRWLGIEREQTYVDIIKTRLQQDVLDLGV